MIQTWQELLEQERSKPYFAPLLERLSAARAAGSVYPPEGQELRALQLTPLCQIREVWIGQDPYHRPGLAHGLAFSVPPGVQWPPSLRNIVRELDADGCLESNPIPESGDLSGLARSGVLLLNTVLTVAGGKPKSHAGKEWDWGWEQFTSACFTAVAAQERSISWLCMGKDAERALTAPIRTLLEEHDHVVIAVPHPAADGYGGPARFSGSRPFSRLNNERARRRLPPLDYGAALRTPARSPEILLTLDGAAERIADQIYARAMERR